MISSKLPRRFMRIAQKRGKLDKWLDFSKKQDFIDMFRVRVETPTILTEAQSWQILTR